MKGEPLYAVPKPAKRAPKERSRLRPVGVKKAKRIAAGIERPGMSRGRPMRRKGNGTYANRDREFGRMLFIRSTLPCAARAIPGIDPCRGENQCAHLGDRRTNGSYKKCPDHECGCLCRHHHELLDNPPGWTGKGGYYLAMSPEARLAFRVGAIQAADDAWMALTPQQRDWWDEKSAREFALRGEARRAVS